MCLRSSLHFLAFGKTSLSFVCAFFSPGSFCSAISKQPQLGLPTDRTMSSDCIKLQKSYSQATWLPLEQAWENIVLYLVPGFPDYRWCSFLPSQILRDTLTPQRMSLLNCGLKLIFLHFFFLLQIDKKKKKSFRYEKACSQVSSSSLWAKRMKIFP